MTNLTRRQFLTRALAAIPVIAAGEQLAELLLPKRTIFLPPRGGWRPHVIKWHPGSYTYIDRNAIDVARELSHVGSIRGFETVVHWGKLESIDTALVRLRGAL